VNGVRVFDIGLDSMLGETSLLDQASVLTLVSGLWAWFPHLRVGGRLIYLVYLLTESKHRKLCVVSRLFSSRGFDYSAINAC
jgi:hypothetical protein